jgi:serine/threonine protein kinase
MLSDGRIVAIKRSSQGSTQGGLEFKTEIELLSRVHHKNLVGLVGFCFEKGERMLVYEFISNGTLRESLSGMLFNSVISSFLLSLVYLHNTFLRQEWETIRLEQET